MRKNQSVDSVVGVYSDKSGNIVDCGIFYKIIPNKYVDDFLSGNLWMNRLDYFRTRTDNKALGDSMEGLISHIDKGTLEIFDQKVFEVKDFNVFANSKYPIFCVSFPDHFEKNKDGHKYTITEETIDKLTEKKYNEYTIVFIEKKELIDRFEGAILKNGLYAEHGKIIYNEKGYKLDKANPAKYAGFIKRKEYEYQKEYRFVIHKDVDTHYILPIGNINDICKAFPIEHRQEMGLLMCFEEE